MNDPEELPLFTDSERAEMLVDIASVSLAAARSLYPAHEWQDLDIAGGTLLARKSPIERLALIVHLLPELTCAVERVSSSPLMRPITVARRAAPPVRARRVAASAILRAAREGHAGEWLEETRTALTADTHENRALLSFLEVLRGDALTISRMADAIADTDTAAAARQAARRLRGLTALSVWNSVTRDPAAWTAAPTHLLLSHPAYAPVAAGMSRYRRAFKFDWQHPVFAVPAREMWQLYETWGLFQTLRALLALGCVPRAGTPGRSIFAIRRDRLALRLAKGVPSRIALRTPKGAALSLFYNQVFPAGQRSLSRTMQPDIALETDNGDTFLLDPKFKAYREPGDEAGDIDQMHAYRDAITNDMGGKVVCRAWCLYAGAAGERPVISYHEMPGRSIVGALRLRPADPDGFARLCSLLAHWLSRIL